MEIIFAAHLARGEKNSRPTQHHAKNLRCLLLKLETNMFYNRNNMDIVQVFSSCARIIEVVKRCRASCENFLEEIFSTPTHGFLIIFLCLLSEPQNIFDAPFPTFDSDPPPSPAINNDRSLGQGNQNL